MDMWKPFRNVTTARAPLAAILFDKFHVMRHLGAALDRVRKSEYARLSDKKPPLYQGAEIHAAFAQGEPHARRPEGTQDPAARHQTIEHCLSAQGVIRPVVEL